MTTHRTYCHSCLLASLKAGKGPASEEVKKTARHTGINPCATTRGQELLQPHYDYINIPNPISYNMASKTRRPIWGWVYCTLY